MDVQKSLLAVACVFALSACGNSKTSESVFPDNGALDSSACRGQAIESKFIVQWEDGRFTVESGKNADDFKKNFIEPQLADIRYVEFDREIKVESTNEVHANAAVDSWGQDMVEARTLWSQGIQGQGIKVGIVDAFVDSSHAQIQPRIAVNGQEIPNNGVDDDKNGIVDDYYGAVFISSSSASRSPSSHGTHVAGIIAADHRYGNIEGMAPQAQIVPAQFISDDGGGSLGDAVLALQYVASRGVKIINASWGGAPCVASLRNAFKELENKGVLVVVAAGNDGRDIDSYPEFPASFNLSNQITVAASSVTDFMTSWSNSGFELVHLAAPGDRILSTVPGNTSAYMDGTSMAAPFVSGAAALLWGAKPNATATQIKTSLLQSVDVRTNQEFRVHTRGRLNVRKAYQVLQQLVP